MKNFSLKYAILVIIKRLEKVKEIDKELSILFLRSGRQTRDRRVKNDDYL